MDIRETFRDIFYGAIDQVTIGCATEDFDIASRLRSRLMGDGFRAVRIFSDCKKVAGADGGGPTDYDIEPGRIVMVESRPGRFNSGCEFITTMRVLREAH